MGTDAIYWGKGMEMTGRDRLQLNYIYRRYVTMSDLLQNYPHAMSIDPDTGKVMPKQANLIEAVNSKTVRTHDAVSVGASSYSHSPWFKTEGFDRLVVRFRNDASKPFNIDVKWAEDSAGTGQIVERPMGSDRTALYDSLEASVKGEYCQITLLNRDPAVHTMSAWAYLKV